MTTAAPKLDFWAMMSDFQAILRPQLRAELAARQAAGTLAPVTGLDAYRFSFVNTWNRFVAGGFDGLEPHEENGLLRPLVQIVAIYAHQPLQVILDDSANGTFDPAGLPAALEGVVAAALADNSRRMHVETHSLVAAGPFFLTLEDWAPAVLRFNPGWDRDQNLPYYLPLEPLAVAPLTTAVVDFPSGHLIFNDWVHIDAFTQAVEDPTAEINFAAERVKRTLKGLAQHNILEIACRGRPGLVVDRDDDGGMRRLRVGWIDTDPKDESLIDPTLDIVGELSLAYRAVTVVDKADLFRILTGAGVADPEAAFQAWRNGMGLSAIELQVPAGTWELAFIDQALAAGVSRLEDVLGGAKPGFGTLFSLTRA